MEVTGAKTTLFQIQLFQREVKFARMVGVTAKDFGKDWALNPPKSCPKCGKRVKTFYINLELDQVSSDNHFLASMFLPMSVPGGHV